MGPADRVSVIIPAFNAARFIPQTLQATLAQTYPNVEIVVVDDASSDRTVEVVRDFGERITLIRHERQVGVSLARNAGAARATGTWLTFLDADDWWPPTFIEQAMELAEPRQALCYDSVLVEDPPAIEPVGLAAGKPTLHGRAHPWAHTIVDRSNLAEMFDGAPLLKSVVHRDDFAASGGFDSRFRVGEDFHYHVKLVVNGVKLRLVEEPHGFYRVHAGQTTAATSSGEQRDPVRQVESCREWIRMYETMPKELAFDARSVRACRQGRRYWRYRYARAAAVLAVRSGRWQFVADPEFVPSAFAAVPVLSRLVLARLARCPR